MARRSAPLCGVRCRKYGPSRRQTPDPRISNCTHHHKVTESVSYPL